MRLGTHRNTNLLFYTLQQQERQHAAGGSKRQPRRSAHDWMTSALACGRSPAVHAIACGTRGHLQTRLQAVRARSRPLTSGSTRSRAAVCAHLQAAPTCSRSVPAVRAHLQAAPTCKQRPRAVAHLPSLACAHLQAAFTGRRSLAVAHFRQHAVTCGRARSLSSSAHLRSLTCAHFVATHLRYTRFARSLLSNRPPQSWPGT